MYPKIVGGIHTVHTYSRCFTTRLDLYFFFPNGSNILEKDLFYSQLGYIQLFIVWLGDFCSLYSALYTIMPKTLDSAV